MNVYIFSLLITSILSLVLMIYLWMNRTARGGKVLLALVAAVSAWSFLYAIEIGMESKTVMVAIVMVEYLAILSVPPLWLVFSLEYGEIRNRFYPKYWYLLLVIPVIILLFNWTNEWHHLYYSSISATELDNTVYLNLEYGPVYVVNAVYAYLLTIIGSVILIQKAFRTSAENSGSTILLGAGALIPVLTHIISMAGWFPNPYFDPTPIGLALAMMVLAISIFRYKILDVIPTAQNTLFSRWKDAFFILDVGGKVLEVNLAAADLPFIHKYPEEGDTFEVIPELIEFISTENHSSDFRLPNWEFSDDSGSFYFDIRAWLIEEDGEDLGWMVGIRDVTETQIIQKKLVWREQILTSVHQAEIEFLQSSDFETGIREFLKSLAESIEFSHLYVYQHSIDEFLQSSFEKITDWHKIENEISIEPPVIQSVAEKHASIKDWPAGMSAGEIRLYHQQQLDDKARTTFEAAGVVTSVTVPIFVENQLWGVLGLDCTNKIKQISLEDAEVFFSAANAIGAAIYRGRVYQEMDQKAGFLTFLGQLSLEGNRDQSFEELQKNLTQLLKDFSKANHVLILPQSVVESGRTGKMPDEIMQVFSKLEDSKLPLSLSPADDDFPEGFLDFKAVIGFPVLSSDFFLGAILFFFQDFKSFKSEEIEDYIQAINQIGLILAKAESVNLLETHVQDRTRDYQDANIALKQEIEEKEIISRDLIEKQEMYLTLFEHSTDPVFILDLDGKHINVNQKAADILGYTRDELVNLSRDEIVIEEEWGKSSVVLEGLLEGQEFPPFERTFRHKDGHRIPMEINVSIIQDNAGSAQFVQSVARDISGRNERENRIELQFKRLNSLRKIDRMVSTNLDLYLTLDILVREVIDQLDVDAANVLLLNRETNKLMFESGFGFEHPAIQTTEKVLGEGTLGKAAQNREMLRYVRSELAADFAFERFIDNPDEGFVSYFAFPLEVQGNVQGVLEVFHRQQLNPTEEWLDFLETLASQAAIAIDNSYLFTDLQKSNKELEQAYVSTLEGWARALDLRDNETAGHTERVTELTVSLGSLMGLNPEELVYLQRGAILHDIGKMGVPDAILLKPGKLDPEEREIMEQHPQYAYNMLSEIDFLIPSIDIPYGHHEKWDGTGYPQGLGGEDIPLGARIFSIVDVWDALTSDRPYRKAWTSQKTFDYILELSGSHFDPQVVNSFAELLEYTTDFEIDWEAYHNQGDE